MSRDPQDIRSIRPELPFDEVISDPNSGHPDRGAALLDLHKPRDPSSPHEPLNAPAGDLDALAEPQLGLHPS
jgi:hypothetical protein